jgi:hypothetical protein
MGIHNHAHTTSHHLPEPMALSSFGAFSVAEFCRSYGISRSLAYEERRAGRIRFRKVGARTLILASDAEEWARALPEVER